MGFVPGILKNGTLEQKSKDLRVRTKDFALQIVKIYQGLPDTGEAKILGKQMLRSGTSVGAQYREAKRSRSKAEFLAKVQGALQELEETAYWLELLIEAKIVPVDKLQPLCQEQNELTAMFVATANTAHQRNS